MIYMYGYDKEQPEACFADLKARGVTAVVGGSFDKKAIKAACALKMDCYICHGAFSKGSDFSRSSDLAVDVEGTPRTWFSSACPNHEKLFQTRMGRTLEAAQDPAIKGVFIDGARFASAASPEGTESFWTCFCSRCEKKAHAYDMDFDKIKKGVLLAKQFVQTGAGDPFAFLPSLFLWFEFRKKCIDAYFQNFHNAVKSVRTDCLTGAFVFAGSLCKTVGQHASSIGALDIIAPMIYRRYKSEKGPACLNHEWAALMEFATNKTGLDANMTRQFFAEITSIEPDGRQPQTIVEQGYPPERLAEEVRQSLERYGSNAKNKIMPIVQIDDDQIKQSIQAIKHGGASGIGFFAYDPAWLIEDIDSIFAIG